MRRSPAAGTGRGPRTAHGRKPAAHARKPAAPGGQSAPHGGPPDDDGAGRSGMCRPGHALGVAGPHGAAAAETGPPLWFLARSTAGAYSDAQWLFTHLEHCGAVRLRLGPLPHDGRGRRGGPGSWTPCPPTRQILGAGRREQAGIPCCSPNCFRRPAGRGQDPGGRRVQPGWRPASCRSGSWRSSSGGPPRSAPGPDRSWRSAPCWAARSHRGRWPRSSVRHPHGCCRTSRPRCGPICSWRHRTRSYSTGSWCGGHSPRVCPGPPGAAPADRPAAAGPGWPGDRGRRSPGQRGRPSAQAAGPAGPRGPVLPGRCPASRR